MKKSRIALVIALITVMLFTFAGCGGDEDKFVGTWTTKIDMLPALEYGMNEAAIGDEETSEALKYFEFSSFEIVYCYTFNDDGTYKFTIDEDELAKEIDKLRSEARVGLEKMIQDVIDAYKYNVTLEEYAELAEFDFDATAIEMFPDSMIDELVADLKIEGNFEAKDGKLYCSDGLEYAIDELYYETYEISDTELKILDCVVPADEISALDELEEYGVEIYPMTLTRAK